VSLVRRVVLLCCVAGCLATCAVASAAAPLPTTSFQFPYRAYNLFDGWKSIPDKCNLTNNVYGRQPAVPGKYPVLVYLHGTLGDYDGNQEGQHIAELAAEQGFVGAAFTYSLMTPSQASVDGQAKCMFDPTSPGNALAQVCAMPEADCSNGILVSGFSAGGAIAMRSKNFYPGVQAAWIMGVNGPVVPAALAAPAGTRALPDNRLRMDIGQTDIQTKDKTTGIVTTDFSKLAALNGQSCRNWNCLRADGSGYFVVQNSEVADGVADHCWWERVNKWVPTNSCTYNITFDPGFIPPSTVPWSVTTSLNWLRAQLPSGSGGTRR
jgi:poly(3-hydroxybutyrate) depolymerase